MGSWTQAQNDAGWRMGFGGWLVGEKVGVVQSHAAFVACLEVESEHIERQWQALEAALPILDVDIDGVFRMHVPEDRDAAVAAFRGLELIRWGDPAPDPDEDGTLFGGLAP